MRKSNNAGGVGNAYWYCNGYGTNKGCAYTMFNNFKGLKLQGIQTLPNVGRLAGPGGQPAGDWYAEILKVAFVGLLLESSVSDTNERVELSYGRVMVVENVPPVPAS